MSRTTMTEEFWRAHRHLGFDWSALCSLAVMGFEAAFLPWREKQALIATVRSEIEEPGPGDSTRG